MSQSELASLTGMAQNAISRLESAEYGRPSITTLKRLAAAFDVALIVRFAPFRELTEWVSNLSAGSLKVPSFSEEEASIAAIDRMKENPGTTGGQRKITVIDGGCVRGQGQIESGQISAELYAESGTTTRKMAAVSMTASSFQLTEKKAYARQAR